jgi:glycosyltransferase involved in cell wall biosynthesis
MKLSIVLPIYNEEENISTLYTELSDILKSINYEYEIIFVNDGSHDNSMKVLIKLAKHDKNIKIINFVHNFGQTAAMSAGIKYSCGDIIIPMDSDLQNDPADIPLFLDKIQEGYDVVSGWRKNRWQGAYFSRRFPSIIANRLIGIITGIRLHDYGCSMKAYRRDFVQGVNLYGEMHRFIPAYIAWNGGRITEIAIHDRLRGGGKTHYGISRTFKVLLDLVVVKFLFKYINRPMHFFGGIGFISFSLGVIAGLSAIVLKIMHMRDFVATPLPTFSALFLIVGVQLAVMGVLAEMIMRVYYETQNKETYLIKDKINFKIDG